jgi:hypothetical protein
VVETVGANLTVYSPMPPLLLFLIQALREQFPTDSSHSKRYYKWQKVAVIVLSGLKEQNRPVAAVILMIDPSGIELRAAFQIWPLNLG